MYGSGGSTTANPAATNSHQWTCSVLVESGSGRRPSASFQIFKYCTMTKAQYPRSIARPVAYSHDRRQAPQHQPAGEPGQNGTQQRREHATQTMLQNCSETAFSDRFNFSSS